MRANGWAVKREGQGIEWALYPAAFFRNGALRRGGLLHRRCSPRLVGHRFRWGALSKGFGWPPIWGLYSTRSWLPSSMHSAFSSCSFASCSSVSVTSGSCGIVTLSSTTVVSVVSVSISVSFCSLTSAVSAVVSLSAGLCPTCVVIAVSGGFAAVTGGWSAPRL